MGSGLILASVASSAAASVTIGQLAPGGTPSMCTFSPVDRLQPTVTSGTSYVVPSIPPATALVISSWSYNATGTAAGQEMTMKVFRKIGDPATYQAVHHDGPRAIAGGTVNTFSADVPVTPGDVLGTNQPTSAQTTCIFSAPGDSHLFEMTPGGNLADGESTSFSTFPDQRVNVSAVVAPSNSFRFGDTIRNKKRGTATLTVSVPNPGDLIASGNGVKAAGAVSSRAVGAGEAKLLIKAKGKKKRKLNDTGRVKLNVAVTYTPTGGDAKTQSVKVKLKKL
jgi:hypothetical protein